MLTLHHVSALSVTIGEIVRDEGARGRGSPLVADRLWGLKTALEQDHGTMDQVPADQRDDLLQHLRQNVIDGLAHSAGSFDGIPMAMALHAGGAMSVVMGSAGLPAEAFSAEIVEPLVQLATTVLDAPRSVPRPREFYDLGTKMVAEMVFVKHIDEAHREAFIRILTKALAECGPGSAGSERIWEHVTGAWRPRDGRWFALALGSEARVFKVTPLVGLALRLLQTPSRGGDGVDAGAFHVSGIKRSMSMADDFVAAFLWIPAKRDEQRVRQFNAMAVEDMAGALLDPRWPVAELVVDKLGKTLLKRMSSDEMDVDERLWYMQLFGDLSYRVATMCRLEKDAGVLSDVLMAAVNRRLAVPEEPPPDRRHLKRRSVTQLPGNNMATRLLQMALLDSLDGECADARLYRVALWRLDLETGIAGCAKAKRGRCAWFPCGKRARLRREAATKETLMAETLRILQQKAAPPSRPIKKPLLSGDDFKLASWYLARSREGAFQWYVEQTWTLDPVTDTCFPSSVVKLRAQGGGVVYLVGSCHVSRLAADHISLVIRAVQPHAVCVELDPTRVNILKETADDDANSRVAREGVDMRRASREARHLGCELRLVDRDVYTTMVRGWHAASCGQCVKLCACLLLAQFAGLFLSPEDVEKTLGGKDAEERDDIMSPAVNRVILDERNTVLAYNLQLAAKPDNVAHPGVGTRVVGVVGAFHVSGITEVFGNVTAQQAAQMTEKPPPLSRLQMGLAASLVLVVALGLVLVVIFVLLVAVIALFFKKLWRLITRCC